MCVLESLTFNMKYILQTKQKILLSQLIRKKQRTCSSLNDSNVRTNAQTICQLNEKAVKVLGKKDYIFIRL